MQIVPTRVVISYCCNKVSHISKCGTPMLPLHHIAESLLSNNIAQLWERGSSLPPSAHYIQNPTHIPSSTLRNSCAGKCMTCRCNRTHLVCKPPMPLCNRVRCSHSLCLCFSHPLQCDAQLGSRIIQSFCRGFSQIGCHHEARILPRNDFVFNSAKHKLHAEQLLGGCLIHARDNEQQQPNGRPSATLNSSHWPCSEFARNTCLGISICNVAGNAQPNIHLACWAMVCSCSYRTCQDFSMVPASTVMLEHGPQIARPVCLAPA
jgi:hypothetical protein